MHRKLYLQGLSLHRHLLILTSEIVQGARRITQFQNTQALARATHEFIISHLGVEPSRKMAWDT